MIIAIDGPAGAGKSTVARGVAAALGCTYIDSGAMYRAVAWLARERGVDFADAEALTAVAEGADLRFQRLDGRQVLLVDGRPLDQEIRTPEISHLSSVVSVVPGVRRAMVAQQQRMGACGGVVMEGRDIGTVVFPEADVKVFLTASEEERARRRTAELRSRGADASYEEVLNEVRQRDERDRNREHSPLAAAPDSVEIQTDGLTVQEVIQCILRLCEERSWA